MSVSRALFRNLIAIFTILLLSSQQSTAIDASVEVVNGSSEFNKHYFFYNSQAAPPSIGIQLLLSGQTSERFYADPYDKDGPLGLPPIELVKNGTTQITLSSSERGYYEYRIRSTGSAQIMYQPPHGWHTVAVGIVDPPKPVSPLQRGELLKLGMIFQAPGDPFFAKSYAKQSVIGVHSPSHIANRVDYLLQNNKRDVLTYNNGVWETDDTRPITQAELDRIGTTLGAVLDELIHRGLVQDVDLIQLDRELNGGDWLALRHAPQNLALKAQRVQFELDQRNLSHIMIAPHGRGTSSSALAELDVMARVVGPYVKCILWSFYFHKSGSPYTMPDPDDENHWYTRKIRAVRDVIRRYESIGTPNCLGIAEVGVAEHGNSIGQVGYYLTSGFRPYGLPDRNDQAKQAVKFIVEGLGEGVRWLLYYAGVDKNHPPSAYTNTLVEAFFGLINYAPKDSNGNRFGAPKVGALAANTVFQYLHDADYVSHQILGNGIHDYKFTKSSQSQNINVLWAYPYGTTANQDLLSLGIDPAHIIEVKDMVGNILPNPSSHILIDDEPVFIVTDVSGIGGGGSISLTASKRRVRPGERVQFRLQTDASLAGARFVLWGSQSVSTPWSLPCSRNTVDIPLVIDSFFHALMAVNASGVIDSNGRGRYNIDVPQHFSQFGDYHFLAIGYDPSTGECYGPSNLVTVEAR